MQTPKTIKQASMLQSHPRKLIAATLPLPANLHPKSVGGTSTIRG